MRILKSHPILSIVNGMLIDLPAPSNINYLWGFGSLLGLCLVIQLASGIFLAMHYTGNVDLAFISVEHIMRDVNYGWLLRYIHANGASMFFICVFMHIGRGIYHGSYTSPREMVWGVGVVLLIVMMATAFIGLLLAENGRLLCVTSFLLYFPFFPFFSPFSFIMTKGLIQYSTCGNNPEDKGDYKTFKEKIWKNAAKIYDNLNRLETQLLIREENRQKAGIYILYNNKNEKYYVGSAITNRIYASFRNHCIHGSGSAITNKAIKLHGLENFSFIIYEYYPGIIKKDNLKPENLKLISRESSLIEELLPAYNISSLKHTDLIINNTISATRMSKQTQNKLKFYIDNPEYIENLRNLSSKPVALYDKTGTLIKEYPSIRSLCLDQGLSNKAVNKALKNSTPLKEERTVKYIGVEDQ